MMRQRWTWLLWALILTSSAVVVTASNSFSPDCKAQDVSVVRGRDGSFRLLTSSDTADKHDVEVAKGTYAPSLSCVGWDQLQIETSSEHSTHEQLYAAGFLEGAAMASRMEAMFENNFRRKFDPSKSPGADARTFVEKHRAHLCEMLQNAGMKSAFLELSQDSSSLLETNPSGDKSSHDHEYYTHLLYAMEHVQGVYDGYATRSSGSARALSIEDVWLMNMEGDLFDVEEAIRRRLHVNTALVQESSHVRHAADHTALSPDNDLAHPNLHSSYSMISESVGSYMAHWPLDRLVRHITMRGRCSSLVKWLPEDNDIVMGHTTWAPYSEMFRTRKTLTYHLKTSSSDASFVQSAGAVKHISYTSYPGYVTSSDDWYQMDGRLAVMETTLSVLDDRLLDSISPRKGVAAFLRMHLSNSMCNGDAKRWCQVYEKHNSGTYNNQFQIVDFSKLHGHNGDSALLQTDKSLPEGTFYVLESIPGQVKYEDMSSTLSSQKYWGSYNRPYFTEIAEKAKYPHFKQRFSTRESHTAPPNTDSGDFFTYEDCPRGALTKRLQRSVMNVDDMKQFITYNGYKTDQESRGCPMFSIAGRGDLAPLSRDSRIASSLNNNDDNDAKGGHSDMTVVEGLACAVSDPTPFGAVDGKVTSSRLMQSGVGGSAMLVSGPSHANPWAELPAFEWDGSEKGFRRPSGLPESFAFDWINA